MCDVNPYVKHYKDLHEVYKNEESGEYPLNVHTYAFILTINNQLIF